MTSIVQLQRFARKWHNKVSSILFAFFFLIAITGVLLGWKSLFASRIYSSDHKQSGAKSTLEWLPLDSLQKIASNELKGKVAGEGDFKATSMNALLDKGSVRFTFKNQYNVQLNAKSGELISIEKKATDLLIKIHDGEILDDVFFVKGGVMKTTYTSLMGLSLLFLTASGFWMLFGKKKISK